MDEAIEALARVLANEELYRADAEGYGWDAEKDSSDHFMPTARKKAARYLKSLEQYLPSKTEWGVFRVSDPEDRDHPCDTFTFETKERTQRYIENSYVSPEIWEPRQRIVGKWGR